MKLAMNRPLQVCLTLTLAACASVGKPTVANVAGEAAVQVYAAGSLRGALMVIAKDYEASTGQKIALTFGASGLLREQIEKGESAQVFASADTEHPLRLAQRGGWQAPKVLVRNTLCALTSAEVSTTPATVLDTLLAPLLRLGTSTPKSDPSGDYTWELFHRADVLRPGAYTSLDAKAQKLVGQTDSLKPPEGRLAYSWIMEQGLVDVFLTYCTNAVAAQQELRRLKVVQLPPTLQVGAAYGLTVRANAPQAAVAFGEALLAAPAQAVFSRFGFGLP